MIIDTQLQDDIFRLEREYEQAKLETDMAVLGVRSEVLTRLRDIEESWHLQR